MDKIMPTGSDDQTSSNKNNSDSLTNTTQESSLSSSCSVAGPSRSTPTIEISTPNNNNENNNSTESTTVIQNDNNNVNELKQLKDLNEFISCFICKGYLIDATTVIECLHSFCKTCIIKYFDDEQNPKRHCCPKCGTQIHKTKPKLNIRSDPTLQDIVYKLVPGLYKNEMKRRKEFYGRFPEKSTNKLSNEERGQKNGERMIISTDDIISISIDYFPHVTNPYGYLPFKNSTYQEKYDLSQPRYLLCKAGTKVLKLKKLIRSKFKLDDAINVDFFYKHEPLRDDYTLMDLAYIYSWRRNAPMALYYLICEKNLTREDYLKFLFKNKQNQLNANRQSGSPPRMTRLRMKNKNGEQSNDVTNLVEKTNDSPMPQPTTSQIPSENSPSTNSTVSDSLETTDSLTSCNSLTSVTESPTITNSTKRPNEESDPKESSDTAAKKIKLTNGTISNEEESLMSNDVPDNVSETRKQTDETTSKIDPINTITDVAADSQQPPVSKTNETLDPLVDKENSILFKKLMNLPTVPNSENINGNEPSLPKPITDSDPGDKSKISSANTIIDSSSTTATTTITPILNGFSSNDINSNGLKSKETNGLNDKNQEPIKNVNGQISLHTNGLNNSNNIGEEPIYKTNQTNGDISRTFNNNAIQLSNISNNNNEINYHKSSVNSTTLNNVNNKTNNDFQSKPHLVDVLFNNGGSKLNTADFQKLLYSNFNNKTNTTNANNNNLNNVNNTNQNHTLNSSNENNK